MYFFTAKVSDEINLATIFIDELIVSNFKYVSGLLDLPDPIDREIILLPNYTYNFTQTVDLGDNYLICAQNTILLGFSSENCKITSSLLSGEALINSNYTCIIKDLDLSVSGSGTKILNLDATGNSNQAIDWFGVNFSGGEVGLVKNYNNFIMGDSAILSATNGFTFDGTFGTIGIKDVLFGGLSSSGTYINIPSTTVITRRLRVSNSSFVCPSGVTGINLNASATIPNEGYILSLVNFSGGSTTYLNGVDSTSDKALFLNVRGINNTSAFAQYSMRNNATVNNILVAGTFYKINGTTTSNALNSKFTHSNNRLTYTGSLTRNFKIDFITTVSAGNNHDIRIRLAKFDFINNTLTRLLDSEMSEDTSGTGRASNIKGQGILSLKTNDYIEIHVTNNSATGNITVEQLNVSITEVSS